MIKKEFITSLATRTGFTKVVTEKFLQAFIDIVTEELIKGGTVKISGFGSFEVRERKGRMGTNPQTGVPIEIASSQSPVFRASKCLKDSVNGR